MFIILAMLCLCGMEVSMSCNVPVIQECAKHAETLIQNAGKEQTKETVCPVLDAYEKCLVDKAKCDKNGVITAMKNVRDSVAKLNIDCTGMEVSSSCDPNVVAECENRYTEAFSKIKEPTKGTVCPVLDVYEKCLVDTAKCNKDHVITAVKDVAAKQNIDCAGKEVSSPCDVMVITECENRYTESLLKIAGKVPTKETVCPVLDAYEKCLVNTAKCGKDRVISAMKLVKDAVATLNVDCTGKEFTSPCDPTVVAECSNRYTEALSKFAGKEPTKETVCPVLDAYEKCLVDTAKCGKDEVIFGMKIVKDVAATLNVHCAGANAFLSFGLLVFVFILHAVHSKSHSGV